MQSKINDRKRKITASDVAKEAGVSKWTVSRAFTEGASISSKNREKILKIAERIGYRPNLLARSLSKQRTNIVGLVVDNFDNPHKLLMLNTATEELQKNGKTALLLNITGKNCYASVLAQADQFQVDGLIFLGTVLSDELLTLARDIQHIPLVVLGRSSNLNDIQIINTNDEDAGARIANLLLDQGHKKLAYMAGPEGSSTHLGRLEGYKTTLASQGIQLDAIFTAGSYIRQRGYDLMSSYLRETPCENWIDAIFCENDILAIGCLDAIRDNKAKIGVVGFDDIELATAPSFKLTTYKPPLLEMIKLAIDRIEKPKKNDNQKLMGSLVIRESHL